MNDYKLHLYGKLYGLESCYPFQEFEIDDKKLYLQCSSRFGVKTSNYTIESPIMYLYIDNVFYRFNVENMTIVTGKNGNLEINEVLLGSIVKDAMRIIEIRLVL